LADDISHCLSSINPLNLVQVFLEKWYPNNPEQANSIVYKTARVCFWSENITISKQMVSCDKEKTALVCFWSAFLGRKRHETAGWVLGNGDFNGYFIFEIWKLTWFFCALPWPSLKSYYHISDLISTSLIWHLTTSTRM
jgi:hypothetical protein